MIYYTLWCRFINSTWTHVNDISITSTLIQAMIGGFKINHSALTHPRGNSLAVILLCCCTLSHAMPTSTLTSVFCICPYASIRHSTLAVMQILQPHRSTSMSRTANGLRHSFNHASVYIYAEPLDRLLTPPTVPFLHSHWGEKPEAPLPPALCRLSLGTCLSFTNTCQITRVT